MIPFIENDLTKSLKNAKKVYVAVALIKDFGLKLIESAITENPVCTRKYLVGIHLPTPPKILRDLLLLQKKNPKIVEVKLFRGSANYHPKVYLIENIEGSKIAYVGSANATKGGFRNNIEMNIEVTDSNSCNNIQNWFDELFRTSFQFDEAFIQKYEVQFNRNKALRSTQKSNLDSLLIDPTIQNQNTRVSNEQYFNESDFIAFSKPFWRDTSQPAKANRIAVRKKFLELRNTIHPKFLSHDIVGLYKPPAIIATSKSNHTGRDLNIPKEALWLHFGKSKDEINSINSKYNVKTNFTGNIRMQIILRNSSVEKTIGIWLYIGMKNRSRLERKHLKEKLKTDPIFCKLIYDYLIELGGVFYIYFSDQLSDQLKISDIKTEIDVINFLLRDNYKTEFYIGRDYDPNDPSLSIENIEETILVDFSKLYKIYDLIKVN